MLSVGLNGEPIQGGAFGIGQDPPVRMKIFGVDEKGRINCFYVDKNGEESSPILRIAPERFSWISYKNLENG